MSRFVAIMWKTISQCKSILSCLLSYISRACMGANGEALQLQAVYKKLYFFYNN